MLVALLDYCVKSRLRARKFTFKTVSGAFCRVPYLS